MGERDILTHRVVGAGSLGPDPQSLTSKRGIFCVPSPPTWAGSAEKHAELGFFLLHLPGRLLSRGQIRRVCALHLQYREAELSSITSSTRTATVAVGEEVSIPASRRRSNAPGSVWVTPAPTSAEQISVYGATTQSGNFWSVRSKADPTSGLCGPHPFVY